MKKKLIRIKLSFFCFQYLEHCYLCKRFLNQILNHASLKFQDFKRVIIVIKYRISDINECLY